MNTLAALFNTLPQTGRICWIGLRTERMGPVQIVERVQAVTGRGLVGDRRFAGRLGGKRQVTLIQAEHLVALAGLLHREIVLPQDLRRNVVVSGINLLALKGKQFQIGEAVMEYSGPCEPCSRMEEVLGPGGYNAMRGHGGITAKVVRDGLIQTGDLVTASSTEAATATPS